jgi:serine/threonine kinase PknH
MARQHHSRTGATGHVSTSIRPGDVLAGRYRLEDLLTESGGGRFWRAHDRVLDRHVAVHCLSADDDRAPVLLDAARRSAAVLDRSILRVLDADERDDVVFVVNEWGEGISLDIVLTNDGPLDPRHAAWVAAEVGASIAAAHDDGVAHGRLNPENVLLDLNGHVRLIGLGVEAALWGLPDGRTDVDVVDLAAVLYAGLTGRWAGLSSSVVPESPTEHGRVLRPRQVRAGIPRPLDTLCDEVINADEQIGTHARAAYDLGTARGITDYLRAFVGDGSDLPAATARLVRRLRATEPLPQALDPGDLSGDDTAEQPVLDPQATVAIAAAVRAAEGAVGPAEPNEEPNDKPNDQNVPQADRGDPDSTEAMTATTAEEPPTPTSSGPSTEQPTELGMPIFDEDSDEVEWLTARSSKPPPPPPFEEEPARPLFAPEPPPGEPARRPRPGAATPSQEFWPWESTGSPTTTTGGTGSGPLYFDEIEEPDDGVPGRNWLRLGMIILVALLLVLAALVAINLFRGRSPLALGSETGSSSASGSPSANGSTGQPVTALTAYDLDPQADPPEEYPKLVPLAVDGDPSTRWHTSTYKQNLGPGGLKTGVGLVVDVGEVRPLHDLTVQLGGSPNSLSIYLSDDRVRFVKGLDPVASETVSGETLQVSLDGAEARYVVIWLTSLPRVNGGFRGAIAEVGITS